MADFSDFAIKWELLISDAWDDEALKARLIADPAAVFKERGISVPDGVSVKIHESSETEKHLVIPSPPVEEELSEEELEAVAGGGGHGHCHHHSHHHSHHRCHHFSHHFSHRHSHHHCGHFC